MLVISVDNSLTMHQEYHLYTMNSRLYKQLTRVIITQVDKVTPWLFSAQMRKHKIQTFLMLQSNQEISLELPLWHGT